LAGLKACPFILPFTQTIFHTMKKIGIIGSGAVAKALAKGFLNLGHDVMLCSRDPGKLAEWQAGAGAHAGTGTFSETATYGDTLVLAVAGAGAEEAVRLAGPEQLAGKTVIDTTNPIAPAPPVDGVLQYFTAPNESLMERLQALAPDAHFVKSFNSVGNVFMVNPSFAGGKPTMFICGNNDGAKAEVTELLTSFGWETADMGKAAGARAIEPLAMLWCIPGMLRNEWSQAFKMLKA
jgi:predicted dinucleotide-binding enzyme